MSMMLIDQTKDSACKTAEADAIRAKTGGSAQIVYDWENNKGFADAISAIPSGGGTLTRTNKYRPPDWPDYDSLQNLPNTGMAFFTFDTQICDPADLICNICWYDYSNTPGVGYYRVQVDRGYIENGQFIARQTWDGLYFAIQNPGTFNDFDRVIPTDEGRYVVYRVWVPSAVDQPNKIRILMKAYTDKNGESRDQWFAPVVDCYYWKCGTDDGNGVQPYSECSSIYIQMNTFKHCFVKAGTSMYWGYTWRFPKYVEIDDCKNSQFSWYYPFNTPAVETAIFRNFTMSNTATSGNRAGQLFGQSTRLSEVVFDNTPVVTNNLSECFQNCSSLRKLSIPNWDVSTVTVCKNCFVGCSSLIDLDISGWDLSAVTNATDMFKNTNKLKNVTCVDTTLPSQNLAFLQSSLLTDTSLVNIANGLPTGAFTLSLHATPKGRLTSITGSVADGVFTEDASGTVTLMDFITNTKGWTVA